MAMGDEDNNTQAPLQPHKNTGDLNSKIMLTAIVSLSIAAVLVAVLHVYARCIVRRRHARGTPFIQQLDLATAQFHNSGPAPKPGLHPAVIAALPAFPFKLVDDEGGHRECAVCLSVLAGGEMVRFLPNCTHTFHVGCIDKWLSSHPTCPVCREEAEPRLVPQPQEPLVGAPPLEGGSCALTSIEGTSDIAAANAVVGGSSSRLSSFRRMLSRERSSRRSSAQSCGQGDDGLDDLEWQ